MTDESLADVLAHIADQNHKMKKYAEAALREVRFLNIQYELSKEGYIVPDCFRALVEATQSFNEIKSLTKKILDDPTGLTAAMYGVDLN